MSMKINKLIFSALLLGALALIGCGGGDSSAPPTDNGGGDWATIHVVDNNGTLHGTDLYAPVGSCDTAGCHGSSLQGDSGPSCTSCHSQMWNNPGVLPDTHTFTRTDPDSSNGYAHHKALGTAADMPTEVYDRCVNCHGADLQGGTANANTGCYDCHGRRWFGGPPGTHTSAFVGGVTTTVENIEHNSAVSTNDNSGCASSNCHGTALDGLNASGVEAATGCYLCHNKLWTTP